MMLLLLLLLIIIIFFLHFSVSVANNAPARSVCLFFTLYHRLVFVFFPFKSKKSFVPNDEWNKHFVHFKRVAQKRSHVKAQTQGLEPIEAIITFNLNCVLFYTRPKSLWYTQTNGTHLCNSALQRMRHTFSDHTHCVNAFCQLFANVCVLLCAHRHISNVRLFFFLLLWNSNKRIGHRWYS